MVAWRCDDVSALASDIEGILNDLLSNIRTLDFDHDRTSVAHVSEVYLGQRGSGGKGVGLYGVGGGGS